MEIEPIEHHASQGNPVVERIALLGLPGAGKSATGARVAALLGWTFHDTDQLVAREAGRPIADIFAAEGEAGFRAREARALRAALEARRVVIATGGGIGERDENRALLRAATWRVTLTASAESLWQRLVAETPTGADPGAARPLLRAAPLALLRELATARQAWYGESDEVLATEGQTAEQVAARIVAGLVARGSLAGAGVPPVERLVAAVPEGYPAVVGWGALATLGARLAALGLPPRLHVIADATVAALYEPPLMAALLRAGFAPAVYRVPAGEASKSFDQLRAVYDWLAERRAERGEAVVALGGGVVGDLAGLAAATYLRGLPLIHVPTTLLAQVDASIGGKTAVDHPLGKNLIGTFYPPRLVLADPAALLTLPARLRAEGWAEVVKHGVALDAAYFAGIERDAEALAALAPGPLVEAIAGSVALKAAVVGDDPREAEGGRRILLNYGHTLGHAFERATGYGAWLHGEAVAVGMAAAARLGQRLGVTPDTVVTRQEALLTRLGLPIRAKGLPVAPLLRAALWDKKVRGGRVRWVLPTALGQAAVFEDVPEEDVRATLVAIGAVESAPPSASHMR